MKVSIFSLLLQLFFVSFYGTSQSKKLGNNGFGLIKGTKKKNANGSTEKPTFTPSTAPTTTIKPTVIKTKKPKTVKCNQGMGNKNKNCRPTQSPTTSQAPSPIPSVSSSQEPSPVYKKKYNLGKVKVPYHKNVNGKGSNGLGNNNNGIEKGQKKQIKKGNNGHGIIKGKKYLTTSPTKSPVKESQNPQPTPVPILVSPPTDPPVKPPKKKKPLGKHPHKTKKTEMPTIGETVEPSIKLTKKPVMPPKKKPLGKVKKNL